MILPGILLIRYMFFICGSLIKTSFLRKGYIKLGKNAMFDLLERE
jgi:hypothetical protein